MRVRSFDKSIWHQTTAVVLTITMSLWATGCTTTKRRPASPLEIKGPVKERVIGITTVEGQEVAFDEGTAKIEGDIVRAKVKKESFEIALSKVERFWVAEEKFSVAKTLGLVAGVVLGALVIALATKQSCPFVYSWDGQKYVFDAEPYGGAVSPGLERDDYTPLDHLQEAAGFYRLLLTNEVNETQYTNFIELWAVDHPAGTRVLTDDSGGIHTLGQPERLSAARDQDGRNLRGWLEATDRKIWEALPSAESEDQRQEIILTFPRPAGATRAKLVYNVATGLWGSNMIREMLLLRGRDVGAWYAAIDKKGPELTRLLTWDVREELYTLKVDVEEPSGWRTRGVLLGGGPFLVKDRIAMLDVSQATGSQLRLRIRPPRGFWALNSFAMDYEPDRPVTVQKLALSGAVEASGKDVREVLLRADDSYYAMPRTGESASLTFMAPRRLPGMTRTMILHSRGYYRLHLPEEGEPDVVSLERIANEPGEAARFAARRYAAWQSARAAYR
jgi:hypothetical protein